jgi:signal transduction histidine kinase/ActR/RegA family two-component response regulator
MLRPLARSIRGKLLLLILAVTFVALFVFGISLAAYEAQTYRDRWVQDLQTQAEILGVSSIAALAFGDKAVAQENLDLLRSRPSILSAAIYDYDGSLFATVDAGGKHEVPARLSAGKDGAHTEGGQIVVVQRLTEGGTYRGAVYLRATYGLYERLADYAVILLVVMLLSLAAALLVGSRLQKMITEPLLAVTNTAHRVIETRDFSLRVSKSTSDEIGYLVDAFNDMLSEIGRRADALIAADIMKDQFLATLAHELRNPLAAISNAVHLVQAGRQNPKILDAAHGMMERQVKQLVRLVDDLLDVSRITTGKLTLRREDVALADVLKNAVEIARPMIESGRHELSVNIPEPDVTLNADSTRLAQVFSNLLNNSAKYTPSGGRIALSTYPIGDSVEVEIKDNGIGIAPDLLPDVFKMFTQADRSLDRQLQTGLGVGLALAKRLVELHGGTIHAESAGVGHGSTFTVRLPCTRASAARSKPVENRTTALAVPYRVVVVDDNADFVDSFSIILRDLGHDVRVAYDGVQGLCAVDEFSPDIAFVDVGLPRLNGYDVARRLRAKEQDRGLVLVAVTGFGKESDKAAALDAGFDLHIVKPLDEAQLRTALHLVAAKRERRELAAT